MTSGAAVFPEAASTLDAFPDFLIWISANGSVVWANRAFARVLGDPAPRLAGRSLFELVETPAERAKLYLRRCTGSRQPLPGSLVFRRKEGGRLECRCDGMVLPLENRASPTIVVMRCRPTRETVSQFTVLNNQISNLTREIIGRRRIEDELRRVNQTLE